MYFTIIRQKYLMSRMPIILQASETDSKILKELKMKNREVNDFTRFTVSKVEMKIHNDRD